MTATEPMLSAWQVGVAALLILVNGALSVGLGLGLERRLAWAAVRTVVQLLAIGFVLQWVFANAHWTVVLALIALMTLIAGHATGSRGARGYAGLRRDGTLSVFGSTWLIGAIGLVVVLRAQPRYAPQ
jgi:putative ABC transport system permease protein